MSFTLYNYVLSGNCYKIRLMASLLGVAYTTVAVDFHPGGEHKSEPLLALNPAGTLPILTTGELTLSETPAMLAWLAAKFDAGGTWWPRQDPQSAAGVLQWLGFSSRLSETVGQARLHTMLNRDLDIAAALSGARLALREVEARLAEQCLRGSDWLVGQGPSIADIACFPYVALSPDAGIEHDIYPAIRAWLYAIRSLDGFVTMPGIHALHELRADEAGHG